MNQDSPLGAVFAELAAAAPDAPAVTHEGITLSRADLERHSNRLAREYQRRGVERDSFVTIALPNGIEFVAAMLATWKAGATPQPMSSRLPAPERDALIELARPALVVGADAGISACAALPAGFAPDPDVSDEPLPPVASASWKAPTSGGSTGRPKLIVSTKPASWPALAYCRDLFRVEPSDVLLITGPQYHNAVFAATATGLLVGGHVVIMSRFDAAGALELVERTRASWMYAVPTMMHRIWRLPDDERRAFDVSSLRIVYHTAAPCPAWLKRAWIDWIGPDAVWEVYGATEALGGVVINGREWLEHEGAVGRPAVGRFRILDSDGREAPIGEIGEVWIRTGDRPATFRYIGAEPRERDGWQSLGDCGRLDDDGYLYLADRETDMILVGGENVYPAEVEAVLDEHPAVASSCVIGLPDEDLGNTVHAIVQVCADVSDDELRAFVGERLVRSKTPRSFERSDAPLRDDAGKVRRTALRAERLRVRACEA